MDQKIRIIIGSLILQKSKNIETYIDRYIKKKNKINELVRKGLKNYREMWRRIIS